MLSLAVVFSLMLASCEKRESKSASAGKLVVVTTLFPLYDFARQTGKERVDVSMLLPPGVEAHAFEPRPADVKRIQKADIFIFTGKIMEPWVDEFLKGVDAKDLLIIDASRGINLLQAAEERGREEGRHHEHEPAGLDPHIWLDFANDEQMVDAITAGFMEKDPAGRAFYRKNGDDYKKKLESLDRKYGETLSQCKNTVIVHAGHFAFGYLARRYHLQYISAYEGFSPDSEPTPRRLAALIDTMKKYGLKTIYYEELITPRVAEAIAKETGGKMLLLSAAHNITKDQLDSNVDFISLMDKNLINLKMGLQCP